jgi:histidinol-phosphate aminotransferase
MTLRWLEKRLGEIRRIEEYPKDTYALEEDEIIKLDNNENFFIPREVYTEIWRELTEDLDPRLYPVNEREELTNALSEYIGLPPEDFVIGNGGDQIIEVVIRAFVKGSERVLSVSPTFSMYRILMEAQGNAYDSVPLGDGFELDSDDLLPAVTSDTVLCFLCSPNNPMGNQFDRESIMNIVKEFEGIVVIDEAYVEFASYSVKDAVEEYENLVVVRTLSKAFGLAGLRVGYAIACPEIASAMQRILLPYNVSAVSLRLAANVVEQRERFLPAIDRIKDERCRLAVRYDAMNGVKAFNSEANFFLVETEKDVSTELQANSIFVRRVAIPDHGHCQRISVGLPEMNDRFLNVLERICDG